MRFAGLLGLVPLLFLPACEAKNDCLRGDCREAPLCSAIDRPCDGDAARHTTVAELDLPPAARGPRFQGVGSDIVLTNGLVVAVIDDLEHPYLLAPTGGNLLDLFAAGGAGDELNQIYQVAGILPDDALRYTQLRTYSVPEENRAGVVVDGVLDGRPDVRVVTRYELRGCERGLRVRTELHNGAREAYTFFLADVAYWGGREPIPFAPLPGQGYTQPPLDLIALDTWGEFPFVATNVGLGWVPCGARGLLEGVNDRDVTALGEPRQIVHPGERVVYERFLAVGPTRDAEGVAAVAHDVRRRLGRDAETRELAGTVTGTLTALRPGDPAEVVARAAGADPAAAEVFSHAVVRADGGYQVTVPAGEEVTLDVWAFGRAVASQTVGANASPAPFVIPTPGQLVVRVTDETGNDRIAQVVIVPADPATHDATVGTQLGEFDPCAPFLAARHLGAPACNRFFSAPHTALVTVPPGNYVVYASTGPFATLARAELTVVEGDFHELILSVRDLPGIAGPWLSTDLHVHGRRSFDSSVPDEDRVRSFVAAGVQVIAATDHDAVGEYDQAVADLELGGRLAVVKGLESTGLIPFMDIPGDAFPRVVGHFNFWPVFFDPTEPHGGAPFDERLEPGSLFDVMATRMPAHGLGMLNHPWDEPLFGRDLGYLRAVGFDPRKPIPAVDDGTAQGVLARVPSGPGGHGNLDFDVIEILNGDSLTKYLQYRQIWFALLNQGRVYAAAANSDSHGLSDFVGWPRNLVLAGTTVGAGFDEAVLNAAIAAGTMVGGYGVMIDAAIDGERHGTHAITGIAGDATLVVEVRAAPWIPVEEVRFWVDGELVETRPVDARPTDPFGGDGLVRFSATIPLSELGLMNGAADAWLVIEAGLPLPAVADLDDDGIVDTTDNDGDGVIDLRDVEDGEESGPLTDPADPAPWGDDPRRFVTIVAPGTWPIGFTNPFLLDLDGDGVWEAPGL